jgi:hypothetical protein
MAKEEPKKDPSPKLGTYKVTFGSVIIGGGLSVPTGDPIEVPEDEAARLVASGVLAPL